MNRNTFFFMNFEIFIRPDALAAIVRMSRKSLERRNHKTKTRTTKSINKSLVAQKNRIELIMHFLSFLRFVCKYSVQLSFRWIFRLPTRLCFIALLFRVSGK